MKSVRSRAITLILGLGLLVTGCSQETNTVVEEEPYIPVEINEASTSTLTEQAIFSGKVFSEQEVAVVPKVPGKVANVRVKVGDKVQAGQVLFTMDTSDYQSSLDNANIAIRSAEINYEMTKEQVEAAETNYERQKELYDAGAIP
ncbi:MAG: biotin/lipoyl-binding protein, partial [Desulfitobacterium sp.]|nr:biotin/lipoyl-binding protein [Desulfitobacterium sp.]